MRTTSSVSTTNPETRYISLDSPEVPSRSAALLVLSMILAS
jgi:hypothetical protein